MIMMFSFVWTITLDTSRSLETAYKCYVIPLPTIFTLGDARVYIGIPDSCDEAFYIETSINDFFSERAIL